MADHPETQTSDNRFMLAAGAMMVLIVALLAGLSIKYHRRAVRAETELSQLKPAVSRQEGNLLLLKQMFQEAVVIRDDMATETVKLNGREVVALKLPANKGAAMGFLPGDVIIVSRPPASRPTATTLPVGG